MPYLQTRDVRLYYTALDFTHYYEPPRTPVLFVHGLGADHTIWQHQLRGWSNEMPVAALDLRGHGRSGKDTSLDYSIAGMSSDVLAVIDALAVSKVHLIGASMGGVIAQWIAINQPERLASLTLVGSFCETPGAIDLNARLQRFDGDVNLRDIYMPIVEHSLGPYAPQAAKQLIFDLEVNNVRDVLRACTFSTFTYSGCDALRQVNLPALVVVGDQDGSAPRSSSEQLVACIQGSRLEIIPRAGHTSYLEDPESFGNIVLPFIRQH